MTTCPCCGQKVADAIEVRNIVNEMRATGVGKKAIKVLADAYPGWVGMTRMVDLVYGDDPNGGPEDAAGVIRVTLFRKRADLASAGLKIETRWGRGDGRRRLVRQTAAAE